MLSFPNEQESSAASVRQVLCNILGQRRFIYARQWPRVTPKCLRWKRGGYRLYTEIRHIVIYEFIHKVWFIVDDNPPKSVRSFPTFAAGSLMILLKASKYHLADFTLWHNLANEGTLLWRQPLLYSNAFPPLRLPVIYGNVPALHARTHIHTQREKRDLC